MKDWVVVRGFLSHLPGCANALDELRACTCGLSRLNCSGCEHRVLNTCSALNIPVFDEQAKWFVCALYVAAKPRSVVDALEQIRRERPGLLEAIAEATGRVMDSQPTCDIATSTPEGAQQR